MSVSADQPESSADSAMLPPVTLVLGGARSGKSAYAESLIAGAGLPEPSIYLATAEAGDAEMTERIRQHQARRGDDWRTVEAPLALAEALRQHAGKGGAVLVDCLTLWLSNLLAADWDVGSEIEGLSAQLADLTGPVVLVSNEVGHGIVPENALARRFRDLAGRTHQAIAAQADCVILVVAGQPLVIKDVTTNS